MVRIVVLADGKEIATREVTFIPRYNCRRAVALVDIPAGAVISSDNVKMETVLSNSAEPVGWNPPYGLIAKRRIAANSVICSHMVGPAKPQILLRRNQTVVIRIERPGLSVAGILGVTTQADSRCRRAAVETRGGVPHGGSRRRWCGGVLTSTGATRGGTGPIRGEAARVDPLPAVVRKSRLRIHR